MSASILASLNPLACSRTAMAPPTLLIAKLSVVVLATSGLLTRSSPHSVPLFEAASWAAPGTSSDLVLTLLFSIAGLAVLLNQYVRVAAAVAGVAAMLTIAGSITAYSAHAALCALMLVLGALHGKREQPVLIRMLVLLVLVIGLVHQLLDPRWFSGARIENWINSGMVHPLLQWVHGLFPGRVFAITLAIVVVAFEAALCAGLAIAHVRRAVVWGLLAFQFTINLLFASEAMGAYSLALGIAALSYLEWPDGAIRVLWPRACGFPIWMHMAFDRYDFDGRLDWPFPDDPDADLEVTVGGRHHTDSRALSALLIHFPVFLMLVFAVLWTTHRALPVAASALIHFLLAAPALTFFALRRIHRVRSRLRTAETGP